VRPAPVVCQVLSRSPAHLPAALAALALAAVAWPIQPAAAAPPGNDWPHLAAPFDPYPAENGVPSDRQAIAEIYEAGPEPGTPSCLGESSFRRTVWYRVPATETMQTVTVEAMGRTLDLVDLAAFVQPFGATEPLVEEANACGGAGGAGAETAEEPTSAVSLRLPAGREMLVQVGRRGARGTPDDERAILSLDVRPDFYPAGPEGDVADDATPAARTGGVTRVPLAGSTVTEEDPAQPACPALGTVWRRIVPRTSGTRLITVRGIGVSTLTVFSGESPRYWNALDCVNRASYGKLQMRVSARARRPLWIRLGSDRPSDRAGAKVRVTTGRRTEVVDGGPGGWDPTTGGPGGGLPAACERSELRRARVSGPRLGGTAKSLNRRKTVALRVKVRRRPVCDVELELRGPGGQTYAEGREVWLKKGRRRLRLQRVRRLVKGRYRLRVTAASELGGYDRVRTRVRGRLR
jgi:hypothetical protein